MGAEILFPSMKLLQFKGRIRLLIYKSNICTNLSKIFANNETSSNNETLTEIHTLKYFFIQLSTIHAKYIKLKY